MQRKRFLVHKMNVSWVLVMAIQVSTIVSFIEAKEQNDPITKNEQIRTTILKENDLILEEQECMYNDETIYDGSGGNVCHNIPKDDCRTKLTCEPGCQNSLDDGMDSHNVIRMGGCHQAARCLSLEDFQRESDIEMSSFLAPKSHFWPPAEISQRAFGPARPIRTQNRTAEYHWFQETVLNELPSSIPQQPPNSKDDIESINVYHPYTLTPKEQTLVKMTFSQWKVERAKGSYSCLDLADALIKRAKYLQYIQKMNHFMYWNTFPQWTDIVRKSAIQYDTLPSDQLAPLYCYPIPLKGTMATKHFPSSLGFASIIYNQTAVQDAQIVELLHSLQAVSFGKTNIPELAHIGATGNYHNGIAFSPWNPNAMVGGSSGGSAAAVASYTAAIAMSEDTLGSTNVPAVRNHIFSYDPPKFRYPNDGNPSLSVRNDQIGIMARSMEDLILLDQALVHGDNDNLHDDEKNGSLTAHERAKRAVEQLQNQEIVIGCSHIYYQYQMEQLTPSIYHTYEKAKSILRQAGYTLLEDNNDCQIEDPMVEVPREDNPCSVWYQELELYVRNYLHLPNVNIWEIVLNGFYDFGTSLTSGWMFGFSTEGGCHIIDQDTAQLRKDYNTIVPARRADVYNRYFDHHQDDSTAEAPKKIKRRKGNEHVHLIMGPAQLCDSVVWTDDILGTCDGGKGRFEGRDDGKCMFHCHPNGVRGHKDKTFTKSKFVVPIGLAENEHSDIPVSLHFMSRAGPGPSSKSEEWVLDKEGPKHWNMEELYIVQRITNTLADGGMKRADATINFSSGLLVKEEDIQVNE